MQSRRLRCLSPSAVLFLVVNQYHQISRFYTDSLCSARWLCPWKTNLLLGPESRCTAGQSFNSAPWRTHHHPVRPTWTPPSCLAQVSCLEHKPIAFVHQLILEVVMLCSKGVICFLYVKESKFSFLRLITVSHPQNSSCYIVFPVNRSSRWLCLSSLPAVE